MNSRKGNQNKINNGKSRRSRYGNQNTNDAACVDKPDKSVSSSDPQVMKKVEETGVSTVTSVNKNQLALVPDGYKKVSFSGVMPLKDFHSTVEFAREKKVNDINSLAIKGLRYYILFHKIKVNLKYAVFSFLIGTGAITIGKALLEAFGMNF